MIVRLVFILLLCVPVFESQSQTREVFSVLDSMKVELRVVEDSAVFTVKNGSKGRTIVVDNGKPRQDTLMKKKKIKSVMVNYQTYVDPQYDVNVVSLGPGEQHSWSIFLPKGYDGGLVVATQYLIIEAITNGLLTAQQLEEVKDQMKKKASDGSLPAMNFYSFCKDLSIGFL